MIITENPNFFSKIIRFQAIFKGTVEFTCALEFKISSQLIFLDSMLLLRIPTQKFPRSYTGFSQIPATITVISSRMAPLQARIT